MEKPTDQPRISLRALSVGLAAFAFLGATFIYVTGNILEARDRDRVLAYASLVEGAESDLKSLLGELEEVSGDISGATQDQLEALSGSRQLLGSHVRVLTEADTADIVDHILEEHLASLAAALDAVAELERIRKDEAPAKQDTKLLREKIQESRARLVKAERLLAELGCVSGARPCN